MGPPNMKTKRLYLNSYWRPLRTGLLLLYVAGVAGVATTTALHAAGANIDAALRTIHARCPEDYPAIVQPLPEADGFEDLNVAELVGMLSQWNPALRRTVVAELAGRGEAAIPKLKQALGTEDWRTRAGATSALSSIVNHQLRNWKEAFPEITDHREAQERIRAKHAELVDEFIRLTRDRQLEVRGAALEGLSRLAPSTPEAGLAVLRLCADEDEHLAQNAMIKLDKQFDVQSLDQREVIAALRKAMRSPLPRGKGHVVRIIERMDAPAQREFVDELLYHLDWQPDRDTMFGAGGQEQAVRLLTEMKVKELIPRIPDLMTKTMRGPGLFGPCMDSALAFGKDTKVILPELRAYEEKLAASLAKAHPRHKQGIEKKLNKLREVMQHVERL